MSVVEYIDYLKGGCYMMPREVSNMLAPYPIQFRIYEHFLKNAIFKPEGILHAGIKLERGQILKSLSLLRDDLYFLENNKRSYYPRKTLSHHLSKLEEKGLIKFVSTSLLGTVYEVVIYNVFQDLESYSNDTMHKLRTDLAQSLHNHRTDLAQTLHRLDTDLAQTLQHNNKSSNVSNVLNASNEKNVSNVSESKEISTLSPELIFLKEELEKESDSFGRLFEIVKFKKLKNISDKMETPFGYQFIGLQVYADTFENGSFKSINLQIESNENLGTKYKNYMNTFYKFLNQSFKDKGVFFQSDEILLANALGNVNLICDNYNQYKNIMDSIKSYFEKFEIDLEIMQKSYFVRINWKHEYEYFYNLVKSQYPDNSDYIIYSSFDYAKNYPKNNRTEEELKKYLKYSEIKTKKNLLGENITYFIPSDETVKIFKEKYLPLPKDCKTEIDNYLLNESRKYFNSQFEIENIDPPESDIKTDEDEITNNSSQNGITIDNEGRRYYKGKKLPLKSNKQPIGVYKTIGSSMSEEHIINQIDEDECFNTFKLFYDKFPSNKKHIDFEFECFKSDNPNYLKDVNNLLPALEKEIKYKNSLNSPPAWKYLENWIKKKCWLDELPDVKDDSEDGYMVWKGNPTNELPEDVQKKYDEIEAGKYWNDDDDNDDEIKNKDEEIENDESNDTSIIEKEALIYNEYIDEMNTNTDIEDFIKERLSDNDYDYSIQKEFLRKNSKVLEELKVCEDIVKSYSLKMEVKYSE